MKRTLIWLALSGLLASAGCGSRSESSAEATVTETVEVAPEACLEALFYADQGFEILADEADVVESLIRSYPDNLFSLHRSIQRLIDLRKPVDDLDRDYGRAKEACEDAAD